MTAAYRLDIALDDRPDALHRLLAVLQRKQASVEALWFARSSGTTTSLVIRCDPARATHVLACLERESVVLTVDACDDVPERC